VLPIFGNAVNFRRIKPNRYQTWHSAPRANCIAKRARFVKARG
jgi:hypothetical protein